MSGDEEQEYDDIPEGAAVFPEIPEDLGVDPLLLAVLHATVFLAGSDESVVQPDAADEAVERMAAYLRRLRGERFRRVREDMDCLVGYARAAKWDKGLIQSLKRLLSDLGVTGDGSDEIAEAEDDEEA